MSDKYYIITEVLSILCLLNNALKYSLNCIFCHLMIGIKFRDFSKVITIEISLEDTSEDHLPAGPGELG